VVKNTGKEEFAKILQRQNKYLEETKKIEIQGITKAMLECIVRTDENRDEIGKRIAMHKCVEGFERTSKSEESGIYRIMYKKQNEEEVNKYIDEVCERLNEPDIPEEARHKTYRKVRKTNASKWELATKEYTKGITEKEEEEMLPSKPPNHWNRKTVSLHNDPNEIPERPKVQQENKARREEKKHQVSEGEKTENKLEETEKKMAKQLEVRIVEMENRCKKLEEKLSKVIDLINNVYEQIERASKRQNEAAEKQTEMIKEK
jgi:hypothetical protein